jgi:hypothetical protein
MLHTLTTRQLLRVLALAAGLMTTLSAIATDDNYVIKPVPPLLVDDEFVVKNQSRGEVILSIPCCGAKIPSETSFSAGHGDILQIVATDDKSPCWGFNEFIITNTRTNETRVLVHALQLPGARPPASICGGARSKYPEVYFDNLFLLDF